MDYFNEYRILSLFKQPSSSVVNVVLQGNALGQIMECGKWPLGKVRLWVLCGANRALLMQKFGFRVVEIGIIPRYKLYPFIPAKKLDLDKKINFIYAGRLSPEKGILHLLDFIRELQKYKKVELTIYGEENYFPAKYTKWTPSKKSVWIRSLKESLQSNRWRVKPQVIHGLSSKEWQRKVPPNSIFISLSQSTHEDFGVAVAEAQQLGLSTVLSAWGAHKDVVGGLKFSDFDIYAPARKRKIEVDQMVKEFLRFDFSVKEDSAFEEFSPESISVQKILELVDSGLKGVPVSKLEAWKNKTLISSFRASYFH